MAIGTPDLGYEVADGVAVITLNRPDARNALNSTMSLAILQAYRAAETDPAVGAILLTGADPAFCAGLDLKEFAREGAPPEGSREVIRASARLRKPAIGAVNGPAMTGGLEIALALDFLVASERATFADTHARVGLIPGGGMTARLPRAVGGRLAREMSFTARVLTANEALALGLVNHVVPHEDLLPVAREIAARIVSCDPQVLAVTRALYDASDACTLAEAISNEDAVKTAHRLAGRGSVPKA